MKWIEAQQLTSALRDAIDRAKAGDVFAAVQVIAPSGRAAQSLGHDLGRNGGVINVSILTVDRFAESLLSESPGQRRLTPEIRRELARKVASNAGTALQRHVSPAFVQSLIRAFGSLRGRADHEVERIGESGSLAQEVVRLYRMFVDVSAPFVGSHEMLTLAASSAELCTNDVIAVVTQPLSAHEADLFGALHRLGKLKVIAVGTGDERLDSALRTSLWGLGEIEAVPAWRSRAVELIAVLPDADAEVRHAVGLLLAQAEEGVSFARMALLYGPSAPYATIIEDQLREAGIPFNAYGGRLSHSGAGRFVTGLLRVVNESFALDAVEAWLASAPIVGIDSTRWGRAARAARVGQGVDQWQQRLAQYAESDDARRRKLDQAARECLAFITDFADLIAEVPTTWLGWACWTQVVIDRYLGDGEQRRAWPSIEQQRAFDVEQTLLRLARLDEFGQSVSLADFAAAVSDELSNARLKTRAANGVFVGSIRDTGVLTAKLAVVLGMAEGVLPSSSNDDALVSVLRVPGEELAADLERRALLLALAGAHRVALLAPRVDQRNQRERRPSPWLLEIASELAGEHVEAEALLAGSESRERWPWLSIVPSYASTVATDGPLATSQQARLAMLAQGRAIGDTRLDEGMGVIHAREGEQWSRFDGVIDLSGLRNEKYLSPTALEYWAQCPFRYFMRTVLGIAENEGDADPTETQAQDRGLLVHQVLQLFIAEVPARTSPAQPWTDQERARLHALANEKYDQSNEHGRSPDGLLAEVERQTLHRQLDMVLDRDLSIRTAFGVFPEPGGVEVGIQVESSSAVPVAFLGRIDRVDRSTDGKRVLAIDYKTGRADRSPDLRRDPVAGGEKLQLALYAQALSQRHPEADVAAMYWFVNDDGDYERHTVNFDDASKELLESVVEHIASGVDHGVFPPNPGSENQGTYEHCRKCPYDSVCPADRGELWERKRNAERIDAFLQMSTSVEAES